jgi:hypothetical protein
MSNLVNAISLCIVVYVSFIIERKRWTRKDEIEKRERIDNNIINEDVRLRHHPNKSCLPFIRREMFVKKTGSILVKERFPLDLKLFFI